MKNIIGLTTFAALSGLTQFAIFSLPVIAQEFESVPRNSVQRPTTMVQDAPPSVIELPAAPAPGALVVPPSTNELQGAIQMPFEHDHRLIVEENILLRPVIDQPIVPVVCPTCSSTSCCCRPGVRTRTVFCLVDPSGCQHQACVNLPACCVGQQPKVMWKGRLFGRQVATLCWDCCDHEVKVLVTRRGEVKVRG